MSLIAALGLAAFTALAGYFFGVAKDRSNVVYAKKMEAMSELHKRVLEIENMELSDGASRTLAVPVVPARRRIDNTMSDEEFSYMCKLQKWREELHGEERKARLWLSRPTVDIVGHYFILMMHCKSWEQFGEGSLVEDKSFLNCLSCIFGNTKDILEDEKIVIRHSQTKRPWLVDCIYLSNKCLEVIQERMNDEVVLFPRLQACCRKWLPSNFR